MKSKIIDYRDRYEQKIGLIVILLTLSTLTYLNAERQYNTSPYFTQRLAELQYVLSDISPLVSWWQPFGVNVTGIPAVAPNVMIGQAHLAVLTQVTAVPAPILVYFPIVQIIVPFGVYFLSRTVLPKRMAFWAFCFGFTYVGWFHKYHEYILGRYFLFPLIFAVVIRYLSSTDRRMFFLFPLLWITLKFTAPGTEAVAVFSIFILLSGWVLISPNQFFSTRVNIAIAVLLFFTVLNPKLYFGAIGGLFQTGGPVTLYIEDADILGQVFSVISHLKGMLFSSEDLNHPLLYSGLLRNSLGLSFRKFVSLTLVGCTAVFGIHQAISSILDRSVSREFLIATALVGGVTLNVFIRGVLLGRFGAKGLVIVLVVVGLLAIWTYLPNHVVNPIILSLLIILSVGIVVGHEGNYQSFQYDESEATVEWETSNLDPSMRLVDWSTESNLQYYYAKKGIANYWEKYQFVGYSPESYEKLINGEGFEGQYIILDNDMEKPLQPRGYSHLEPVENHYNAIVFRNSLSKTYTNGEHTILLPPESRVYTETSNSTYETKDYNLNPR